MMMRRRRRLASLRITLLAGTMVVVLASAAAMVTIVTLALSLRDAVERDGDAFSQEQSTAERIGVSAGRQQLHAYRFIRQPDTLHLRAFRRSGDRVYNDLRGYLSHELSADARLQVERIKETHQLFEVAAQHTFDAVGARQEDAARTLAQLDNRAAEMNNAVQRFLQARSMQRANLRREHALMAERLRIAVVLSIAVLVLLAAALSTFIRRRVLVPLADLSTAAQRLGDGDTTARVTSQEFEEFGVVAKGFNRMADRVEIAQDSVVEHNRELSAALHDLRMTQQELIQHEKLSAMGQMLAGLAHELNNPMAGILGMAELLRDELAESRHAPSQAIGRSLAEPLEQEALRANALVRSLLSFARKPSGTLESVGLAAVVSTAVGLRAHAFAQAGRTLHVEVPPDLHVIAETQKLQHAMLNLVNNALDAAVAAGGRGLVITAMADGPRFVRIDFDDDGSGIEDLGAVFSPFYTTKEAGKGTGLGLALVEKFVGEFSGTVSAENRPGGGARFTLRLLRGTPPAPADTPISARVARLAIPARSHDAVPAHTPLLGPAVAGPTPVADAVVEAGVARHRVLIVDDEPSIREIQRRLLRRAGIDVIVAASGVDARDFLLQEDVDLVVSDLRMPGEMDGYALFTWLESARPELARHALLSTGDVTGTASFALPVPAHRILNKPFEGTEFVQRVQGALELALATRITV